MQLHTGKLLTSLETRWTELVSNVIQIELATIALEAEVEQLRQQELTMEQ
jgi:pre-mRNA-splicing factor SPF27